MASVFDMGKVIKWVVLLLILAALAALAFWLIVIKGQPWWLAAAIVFGVFGLLTGGIFLKRYLIRGRERKFVQRVIDQDTAAIERGPVSQRHELLELQEHWHASVKRLQQSHLRKMGNPLYALPWFLIMGESKTGKTSAVKNARQSTPMSEISRSSGLSGTRNCDWWFFDKAILLDTAGRYTIPIDEGPDLEEWKQFLVLLSKYRKKEPLNGVIVAISADKLARADRVKLAEEGQSIRRRIDQMMRTVGAKFPVYVLITKMDLVHGFCEFNSALPEGAVAQAMGYANTTLKVFWRDILDDAVGSICRSLKNLRFLLAHQKTRPAPGALLFPTEFERTIPGMALFLEAVFAENPYQETPLLRGLYFSSALRKDGPASDFLSAAGLEGPAPAAAFPSSGFFLKDFFAGILPRDRDLFAPLREFVLWRRATRNLGLLSWLFICLAACGLLGFSYYRNDSAIRDFSKSFYDPPALSKTYATDLLILDKMRMEIEAMELKNRGWLLPRFGLNHSVRLEQGLKKQYLKLFKEDFLVPLDRRLMTDIEQAPKISREAFVDYAGYVVAQIGVLSSLLEGEKPPGGNEFPLIVSSLLSDLDPGLIPEISRKFGDTYIAYLNWNPDRDDVAAKLEEFRTALVDLIMKRGQDLRWLVYGWIPETAGVRVEDFLTAAAVEKVPDGKPLPGAFTSEGRKHIQTFMSYIEKALGAGDKTTEASAVAGRDSAAFFQARKKAFWVWYRQAFFNAWYRFLSNFPHELDAIKDETSRQRLALLMTTDQNPYFDLIDKAVEEITALDGEGDRPAFAGLLMRIGDIRHTARVEKQKQTSLAAKVSFETTKLKETMDRRTDPRDAKKLEENLELAHAWSDYLQALGKITVGLTSSEQGYNAYRDMFASGRKAAGPGSAGAGADAPLIGADYAFRKFRTMMTGRTESAPVWDLVSGPRDFLASFAAQQASCYLQDQWRQQVLSYLEGVDPDTMAKVLFDKKEGLVWKFLETYGQPFITRNQGGYAPRKDLRGNALPFRTDFIHFLNQGDASVLAYQPSYTVHFETLPIDVNKGAAVEPFAVTVRVNCADQKFVLENFNYPHKASFQWDPAKCGDTSLSIAFPGFDLHKHYIGRLGFAAFLKEFQDGSHTFAADEFPKFQRHLEQIGVTEITVSYKITGAEAVVRLLNEKPSRVPQTIVQCGLGH